MNTQGSLHERIRTLEEEIKALVQVKARQDEVWTFGLSL